MARVFEVEHGPPVGVRIRLGDLVQRSVVLVDNLVRRVHDASVLNRPLQVTRRLAANNVVPVVGHGG